MNRRRRRRRRRAGKTIYLAFSVSICSTICVAIDAGLLRIKIVSATASSRGRRRRRRVSVPLVSHVYHKKLMVPKENFKFDFESQKLQERQRVLLCCLSLFLSLSLSHTHTSCVRFSMLSSTSNNSTNKTLHRHHHHAQNTIPRTNPVLNPGYKPRLQMKLPSTLVRDGNLPLTLGTRLARVVGRLLNLLFFHNHLVRFCF